MATARLKFRQFSILVTANNSRVVITAINAAKINIYAIVMRFAGPVKNKCRNLERRANTKNSRIAYRILRFIALFRIRVNPDGIVIRHQGIQRDKGIQLIIFRHNALATITFHAKSLLKVNLPVRRMLVNRTRVPATSIRKRPHLDDIVRRLNDHGRRLIFPRALQADYLGFRRVKHQIKRFKRSRGVHPSLVNAGREKFACTWARHFREVRMLRPIVLSAQNLHESSLGIPLRRANRRISKINMTPVLVFPFGTESRRFIQDVVIDLDKECAVTECRVRTPRVVNMQTASRVKAFTKSPDLYICDGSCNSTVHKNRILSLQGRRKVNHRIAIHRNNIPRSLIACKMGDLNVIRLHHVRRNRPIEPTAFILVALFKAHQHRIRAKDHLRQHLVAPRTLEPDNL